MFWSVYCEQRPLIKYVTDTENIPAERTATTGVILLGYMENDSENLDIGGSPPFTLINKSFLTCAPSVPLTDHPLATGFPLKDGKVTVEVPTVIDSTKDYFVVLFGDSVRI